MTYDSLTNAKLTKFFKAGNYKKQIIKNIEIIGQRKLVILGDGRGVNGEILKKVLGQLRKKGVRVPELAFEALSEVSPNLRVCQRHITFLFHRHTMSLRYISRV